jgi:rare lipoprotein A
MKKIFPALLLLACALLLSGCPGKNITGGDGGAEGDRPTGKPYTVRGRTYRPYTTARGFTETGVASWYGPGFHGKTTANGERYNQNAMTAAHKLLPFNTRLRVTNLANGRSIVVRINDRGPFVADRVIDLSRRAAEQLDIVRSGTARVRLEALEGGKPLLDPGGDMPGRFYVQIGAFAVPDNARKLAESARRSGFGARVARGASTGLHQVQVGPFSSLGRANAALARLSAAYPGLFVVAE